MTCFGEDGEGDIGDNFLVVCETKFWERAGQISFQHVETQKYLAATPKINFNERNCGGNCPIKNHLEAFAMDRLDGHGVFTTQLGVFLSK